MTSTHRESDPDFCANPPETWLPRVHTLQAYGQNCRDPGRSPHPLLLHSSLSPSPPSWYCMFVLSTWAQAFLVKLTAIDNNLDLTPSHNHFAARNTFPPPPTDLGRQTGERTAAAFLPIPTQGTCAREGESRRGACDDDRSGGGLREDKSSLFTSAQHSTSIPTLEPVFVFLYIRICY